MNRRDIITRISILGAASAFPVGGRAEAPFINPERSVPDRNLANRVVYNACDNANADFIFYFSSVDDLQNCPKMYSTGSGKGESSISVSVGGVRAGDVWRAKDYLYQVAPESATDFHLKTFGGVNLYIIPSAGGVVTIEQAGGDITGVRDSTSATKTALEVVSKTHGVLLISGTVLLKGPVHLSKTESSFSIISFGVGEFVVSSADGGIKIEASSLTHQISISVKFLAGIRGAGCPLEVLYPRPELLSWRTKTLILDHVECAPLEFNSPLYSFKTGVHVSNAWHGSAVKFTFNGGANNDLTCESALHVDGYSLNFDCYACYATNCNIGFNWGGEAEGARFTAVSSVAVKVGFLLNGTSPNPQGVFLGCHVNAASRAISASRWKSLYVSGCEFYKLGEKSGYVDIELIESDGHRIEGNRVALGGDSESCFVKATRVKNSIVANNVISGRGCYIDLSPDCAGIVAHTNIPDEYTKYEEACEIVERGDVGDNNVKHWRVDDWPMFNFEPRILPLAGKFGYYKIEIDANKVVAERCGFQLGSFSDIRLPSWGKSFEISAMLCFSYENTSDVAAIIRRNGSDELTGPIPGAKFSTVQTICISPMTLKPALGDFFEIIIASEKPNVLTLLSEKSWVNIRATS